MEAEGGKSRKRKEGQRRGDGQRMEKGNGGRGGRVRRRGCPVLGHNKGKNVWSSETKESPMGPKTTKPFLCARLGDRREKHM